MEPREGTERGLQVAIVPTVWALKYETDTQESVAKDEEDVDAAAKSCQSLVHEHEQTESGEAAYRLNIIGTVL